MRCADLMKHRVAWVAPDASASEAARAMRDGCFGMLPVCGPDGRLLGVVTDRDLTIKVCAEGLDAAETQVSSIMSGDVLVCRPEEDLEHAESLMAARRKSRILVVDEGDRLLGIISLTDLAQREEPLRLARLVRDISAREFRVEHATGSA